jgi:large subunit ribosomal protein L30
MVKAKTEKKLTVTLMRSLAKRLPNHIASARGLGLKRIRHTVTVIDTPANRGMINQISYMVKVEEAQ